MYETRGQVGTIAPCREAGDKTMTPSENSADRAFERLRERYFREDILVRRRRPDGRAFDQIRQITCEVGGFCPACTARRSLPAEKRGSCYTHARHERRQAAAGCPLWRGNVQALHAALHFPPFSVGEVSSCAARAAAKLATAHSPSGRC